MSSGNKELLKQIRNALTGNTNQEYAVIRSADKFARNTAVGTTLVDIWTAGTNLAFLGSAETMDVSSGSANDTLLGTGARSVTLQGLDGDWNEISETVDMNGTSAVTTTQRFLRVNRAFIEDVGTIQTNDDDIDIVATTAATTQAQIGAGLGQTLKSQVSIPAGFTALITRFYVNTSRGDDIRFILETREFGKGWRVKRDLQVFESHISVQLDTYITVSEKADIRCRAAVSQGSAVVSYGYDYKLVQ